MEIIGWILMIPIIMTECVIKILWSIVYSIIIPFVKNLNCNESMKQYAYHWYGELRICNWIVDKWT